MTPDHMFLKNHRSPSVIDVDKFPDDKAIDLDPEPSDKADAKPIQAQTTVDGELKDEPTSEPIDTMDNEVPQAPAVSNVLIEGELKDEAISKPSDTTDHEAPQAPEVSEALRAPGAPALLGSDSDSVNDAYEWEPTDDEKAEKSPSPEFEDVPMQSEDLNSGPVVHDAEITQPIDFVDEDAFSDLEDEELLRQLAAEGEEHVRFAATLNPTTQGETTFDYEQELKQLRLQQKKDRRDADEVTQVMITECQQLLTLFGLPYITAPMEAEAQCAELVSLGLVDGIITDDSDIFLFGGTRVYKNMFNQSKYVECYLTSDLEKEYALHRRKLISFAHLLGSDYTEGIPGIGPVTALEILTEFPALEEFRDWWTRVQTGADMSNNEHASFYKKFRKQATKIFLPPTFPDTRVDEAYLNPEADSDPSPFQWGIPDLHGLRGFLMATIGWSQERTDEVLVPVIRDINSREQVGTQSNITSFFSGPQGAGAFAPRVRSGGQSRMEKAFSRLRREAGAEMAPEETPVDEEPNALQRSRRKGKGSKRGAPEPETAVENGDGADGADGAQNGDETTTKRKRGRKATKI
jgi:DNA excision repair protein ERCC-5